MFNLSRFASLTYVVRNFGSTRKLFASTSVLAEKQEPSASHKQDLQNLTKKTKNPTVAAVFASLSNIEDDIPNKENERLVKKSDLDDVILKAKTVNGLLNIAETQQDISRKHALKIVSILAEWSSINKIKLNEFENDSRFTKLCRVLGRTVNPRNRPGPTSMPNYTSSRAVNKIEGFRTDDLNVVLGVTGDDEAAKLVATITLPQMIKVFKNLAIKKRRSTPLLRSLSYNMSSKEHHLDLRQCADVLYAMASLNFPDPVLIAKLCEDVQEKMKEPVEKPSLVGSIVTSLALLKYREPLLLDTLCEWIVKNQDSCRTNDVSAVFMSLAFLNHMPTNLEEPLKKSVANSLTPLDFKNSLDYLGFVWSLMVLNFSHDGFYNSVLQQTFIEKLLAESSDKELPATAKMKLLNINAGVKLFLPTYSGSMLSRESNENIYDVPLIHSREKQLIVNGMIDAIKSLVPENCLRFNKDTNMGFVIDAEFFVDDKGNPAAKESKDGKKSRADGSRLPRYVSRSTPTLQRNHSIKHSTAIESRLSCH